MKSHKKKERLTDEGLIFAGEIPQEIGKLLNLEIFAAESTRGLTGSIPPSFFNISSFIEISFQNNSLSGKSKYVYVHI